MSSEHLTGREPSVGRRAADGSLYRKGADKVCGAERRGSNERKRRPMAAVRKARRRTIALAAVLLALLIFALWLIIRLITTPLYEIRGDRLRTSTPIHVLTVGEAEVSDGGVEPSVAGQAGDSSLYEREPDMEAARGAADLTPSQSLRDSSPGGGAEDAEDVILLARIMQEEDGKDWPDAMIMAIGEVVLNRVASPEFPDTIREVLYQDDGGFVQYAPVQAAGWESIEPEARYIELAERLLAGERVLDDPQVVYQALFEQGRGTVLTYHDFYVGTDTFFCLTERPGLYA